MYAGMPIPPTPEELGQAKEEMSKMYALLNACVKYSRKFPADFTRFILEEGYLPEQHDKKIARAVLGHDLKDLQEFTHAMYHMVDETLTGFAQQMPADNQVGWLYRNTSQPADNQLGWPYRNTFEDIPDSGNTSDALIERDEMEPPKQESDEL